MKTTITHSFIISVLAAGFGLMLAGRVTAQTFTVLHTFTAVDGSGANSDGAIPFAGLVLSGNTLYGTAQAGGISAYGTVFAVNTDGTGFTTVHSFTGGSGGGDPVAGLLVSGNTLFGTTLSGGSSANNGIVFKVNTDGSGFTNLHTFADYPSDGAFPSAGLILLGTTLYGTAGGGGNSKDGTVFKLNTDGTGFTNLHSFYSTDGAGPVGSLVSSGNTLYGTTYSGGSHGFYGTVFAVKTDGTDFTNLHSFSFTDGVDPDAGVLLSGNILYGTANQGASSGYGTVFAVNTDGTGFTNLYDFGDPSGGAYPEGGLVLSSNTLYGTASGGGNSGHSGRGTVFAVNTDGTGIRNLHSFTSTNSEGAFPIGKLVLSGSTLYGTAEYGGSSWNGTLFSISFTPQLTIIPSGANVILSWLTNYAGFDYTGYTLQSTTNLASPVWTTNSPAPVVVNGQNTVTNPISATQQFFRLSQ